MSRATDLHIPALMPDEFILGYVGRVGTANGYPRASDIRNALKKWHYVKTGQAQSVTLAEQLASAAGLQLQNFIRHHTLVPLYRSVVSDRNDHPHGDPRDPGILSAQGPLLMRKEVLLCPQCITEDMDYLGFSFWRRSHQLPGIDWCLKHSAPLSAGPKAHAFYTQPHSVERDFEPVASSRADEMEESSIIQRYASLVQVVLDLPSPIAHKAISGRLSEKLRSLGLEVNPGNGKAFLSDLGYKRAPQEWLEEHFGFMTKKKEGKFLYELDGACVAGGKARSSTSYLLAIALLWEDASKGRDILLESHQSPRLQKTANSLNKYSDRKLISTYKASKGNIREMSKILGRHPGSVQGIIRKRGLPCLTRINNETLLALKDFLNGASLLELMARPNIQLDYFSECLRITGKTFGRILEEIDT